METVSIHPSVCRDIQVYYSHIEFPVIELGHGSCPFQLSNTGAH